MTRKIAVSIASVALILGGFIVVQAGATTMKIGASGGSLTFTAAVRNATTCGWSSSPTIAGFTKNVKCKTGTVARSARFTANTSTAAKSYEVTLTVHGKTTTIKRWKVNQAAKPPPTTISSTTTSTTWVPSTTTTLPGTSLYYLSLGDSYATGAEDAGGYTTKVVADVAPQHTLILQNFACGGATTTSMLSETGCSGVEAPNGIAYPTMTQLGAAISFINAHPGQIGLITIAIGANDLGGNANNVPPIANNIAIIAGQLRAAAGSSVPILGLTYNDVDLADWLNGPGGQVIAEESVVAFQNVINPDWKAAYASANVTFVDITAASGAYTPFSQLVNDPTYGKIPYAVAQICLLSKMCSNNDVHPSDAGYSFIAQQIVLAYLKLLS